ncbi:MAG: TetR family transcriptional regulator C-terminal domain-containing protein, partial [Gammaproteobacteria bacterium]
RGCLICNTGVEIGKRDPEIHAFVSDFYREVAEVMKGCLERAVEKGQVKASRDLTKLATYLATEFRTSLMLAASGVSRQQIKRHLDVALQVL